MSTGSLDTKGKDAILELIKCPICLEIYTDPREFFFLFKKITIYPMNQFVNIFEHEKFALLKL